ncbi:hypothetical protein [Streptosporangium sp. NPDC006007]|uniref:hypothetical protein n=1 Tax=Streptosporangium sp. NPDC006007 TaxID=3154575 RepID=UPI0033AF9A26
MTGRQVTLVGGPLDGMEFPDPDPGADDKGACMIVPGEMSRAVYEPDPGGPPEVWHHRGWVG